MFSNARTFSAPLPDTIGLLRAGDFNGDGKSDLFIAAEPASNGDVLRVFPGDGAGFFGDPIVTQAPSYRACALADFNGDGKPDVLLRQRFTNPGFGVMLGQGDGTFGSLTITSTTDPVDGVVGGDFDADGKQDVLTHEQHASGQARMVLYPGNGSGGFGAGVPSPIIDATSLFGGLTGDFDGDCRLDAALTRTSGTIVFFNNGDRTFTRGAGTLPGDPLAVADFDADGISDLVLGYKGSLPAPTYVYRGRSDRTFSAQSLGTMDSTGAAALDLNGDGRPEVVTISSETFAVVASLPAGTFAAPQLYAGGPASTRLVAADFDGDGKPDVVLAGGRPSFSFVHGNGDGTFRLPRAVELTLDLTNSTGNLVDLAMLDVNGDSLPDIITSDSNTILSIATQLAQPGGGYGAPVLTPVPHAQYETHEAIPVADVDGDGRPDVLVQTVGLSSVSITVMHGNTNGTFSAGYTWQPSSSVAAILDFDGDGKLDVLAEQLYRGNGLGSFGPAAPFPVDYRFGTPQFVDLNHDGRLDGLTSDGYILYARLMNTDGTFTAAQSSGPRIDAVGDMNGDGFPDVMNGATVYPGRGDGTFGGALTSLFSEAPAQRLEASAITVTPRSRARVYDVDGDGRNDLVLGGSVYYGTGTGYFDSAATFPGISTDYLAFPADVDHDGRQELVCLTGSKLLLLEPATRPVGTIGSTTAVSSWPPDVEYGRVVTLTGKVTGSGGVVPTGALRFRDGTRELGIARVDTQGVASVYPMLNGGTTTVTVEFVGDDHLGPQTTTFDQTVLRASTSTSLGTQLTYPIGQPIRLTASVGTPNASLPRPTGTVTFKKGATVIGTGTAGQTFSITDAALFPIGTHTLTAEYAGNTNYWPSVSEPVTITVKKAAPQMTVQVAPSPVIARRVVTLSAVFPAGAGVTGSVAFFVNGAAAGSAPLTNDAASVNYTFATNGFPPVRAEYSGDANYDPAIVTKNVTVYYGDLTEAPTLKLSMNRLPSGEFNPTVSTSAIFGATHYDFYRAKDGEPLTLWSSNASGGTGEAFPANEARFYAVVARDDAGHASPRSNIVIALGMAFTDEPLVGGGTDVKAAHINELQLGINAIRRAAGLPPAPFTSVAPGAIIRAAEMAALHDALAQARTAIGLTTTYDGAAIGPMTVVLALHVQELRNQTR